MIKQTFFLSYQNNILPELIYYQVKQDDLKNLMKLFEHRKITHLI